MQLIGVSKKRVQHNEGPLFVCYSSQNYIPVVTTHQYSIIDTE